MNIFGFILVISFSLSLLSAAGDARVSTPPRVAEAAVGEGCRSICVAYADIDLIFLNGERECFKNLLMELPLEAKTPLIVVTDDFLKAPFGIWLEGAYRDRTFDCERIESKWYSGCFEGISAIIVPHITAREIEPEVVTMEQLRARRAD